MKITQSGLKKLGIVFFIVLLLILIFPTRTGIVSNNISLEARTMAHSIKTGIENYKLEYSQLPISDSVSTNGEYVDFTTNDEFMAIMLGLDENNNPKRVPFISVNPAKERHGKFFGGLASTNSDDGGTVYDPWAHLMEFGLV